MNTLTNDFGGWVKVNSTNIIWYQEYFIHKSNLHAYHIAGTDGSVTCVKEKLQSGGIQFNTANKTPETDEICKWTGYIIGTFYPGDQLIMLI